MTEPLYSNANDRSTESELDGVRKLVRRRKRLVKRRKRVPARVADTRLIIPYTSYLLPGFQ